MAKGVSGTRLTDRKIAALRPRATRYEVWEGDGLGLRIGTSGRRTWVGVYHFGGRSRRMTYGAFPEMSVVAARMAHASAREKLKTGTDPGHELVSSRQAFRRAESFADLAAEYLERHARRKKRSADQDERTLNREIIPQWIDRKAKEVSARDVILLLDRIEARGSPIMRNRVTSLLSKVFQFGVSRGIIETSPAVGIERLDEAPRERLLSIDEIACLWRSLDAADMDRRTALAIRFCLVTGQRRSEVAGIRRSEIDDIETLWTLPGERTKNGRANLIPLPPFAMRIVAEADTLRVRPIPVRPDRKDRPAYDRSPSEWLFPSPQGHKPLEPAALTRALNRNRIVLGIGDARIHDLRRTFATHHGELGTPASIIQALLNHTPQNITDRVYNRATNLNARRTGMEAWCEWLERLIGPGAKSRWARQSQACLA